MLFRFFNAIRVGLTAQFCWDVLLLACFLVGAFSAIWFPERGEPRCFFGFVLFVMSISAWRQRSRVTNGEETAPGGVGRFPIEQTSARFAWISLGGFTLLATLLLWIICQCTGAFRGEEFVHIFDRSADSWLQTKLPTIVGQQIMLQLLLLPVLLRVCGRVAVAVFAAALIFSLLHFPNPILILLTFVAGVVWVGSYYHSRRLTPVVVSHCVLAMIAAGLCGEYILNMRVGPKCVQLFPRRVTSETGTMYEFPGCTVGIGERLIQKEDRLIIEGWTYDSVHHCSPIDLHLSVDDKFIEIENVEFVRSSASRWKLALQSGFVDQVCYTFTASISLDRIWPVVDSHSDAGDDGPLPEIQLFAANVNGNLTRIPCRGDILPIRHLQTGQAVVLFPVEIDGRINVLEPQPDALQFKGWTADLQTHEIPKRMYVEVDGNAREIDIQPHRSPRPDVARALKDPNLDQCGFEFPISEVEVTQASTIRCFVIDDQQQLHPIPFTEHAKLHVAKQLPSDSK